MRLITALMCLWLNPALARGVLSYLAAAQATTVSPAQDAQPGKILHETREGEMAALGEIPFGTYYGTVDATPLFVMLAGAYLERTGDRAFIDAIWPNVEAALAWIDGWGDIGNVLEMLAAVSGFQPRVACRSSDYRFMSALVGAGVGVALVPSLALTGRPDVRDLEWIAFGVGLAVTSFRAWFGDRDLNLDREWRTGYGARHVPPTSTAPVRSSP